jgi:hypothetical protein
MKMRFRVEPKDVPEEAAARRLGLTVEQFREKLPALLQRGFPAADQTTGNYCLEAVDEWRMRRYPQLFPRPIYDGPKSDRETARARIANM